MQVDAMLGLRLKEVLTDPGKINKYKMFIYD